MQFERKSPVAYGNDKRLFTLKKTRGCRISKYFCWAAAPFYAKMASKLITILMPFFTSAVRP
mgnify:CR=1 FL=1